MTLENSGTAPKLASSASTGRLPDKVQDSARTLTPSQSLDNLHKPGPFVLASHLWNGSDSAVKLAPPYAHDGNLEAEDQNRPLAESSSVASLLSVASDSVTPPSRPPPSSRLDTGNVLRWELEPQQNDDDSGEECNGVPPLAIEAEHPKSRPSASMEKDTSSKAKPPAASMSTKLAPTGQATAPAPQSIMSPMPQQHVPTPTWVIEEVIEFCPPADDGILHECDAVSFARSSTSILFDGCYRHPCFDETHARCERRSGQDTIPERRGERRPNLQEI